MSRKRRGATRQPDRAKEIAFRARQLATAARQAQAAAARIERLAPALQADGEMAERVRKWPRGLGVVIGLTLLFRHLPHNSFIDTRNC